MWNTAIKIISFPIALFLTLRHFGTGDGSTELAQAASVGGQMPPAHLGSPVGRTVPREETTDQEWDFPDEYSGQNAGGGRRNR